MTLTEEADWQGRIKAARCGAIGAGESSANSTAPCEVHEVGESCDGQVFPYPQGDWRTSRSLGAAGLAISHAAVDVLELNQDAGVSGVRSNVGLAPVD